MLERVHFCSASFSVDQLLRPTLAFVAEQFQQLLKVVSDLPFAFDAWLTRFSPRSLAVCCNVDPIARWRESSTASLNVPAIASLSAASCRRQLIHALLDFRESPGNCGLPAAALFRLARVCRDSSLTLSGNGFDADFARASFS